MSAMQDRGKVYFTRLATLPLPKDSYQGAYELGHEYSEERRCILFQPGFGVLDGNTICNVTQLLLLTFDLGANLRGR
ncbi:hypothetical protein PRK78_007186 [Emydomyces testavorans]|uniref:Uncharacterized protein n=1 Tax=Emydomyces testavorans TaxID=2070801 RepID=A0AAF0IQ79_9EURO|nr:hypothetical protein PRK78_007186 [Emydomyces testavorans]